MNGLHLIRHARNIKHIRFYTKATSSTMAATETIHENKNATSDTKVKNEPSSKFYDIVICGSGMVGTAMASLLGKDELFKDYKIAIVESLPPRKEYKTPQYHSNRVSALNKSSVDLLKYLDCYEFIEKSRYGKVKQMQVWESCSDSLINFKSDESNDLAIIVENDLVQACLDDKIKNYNNIEILYSSQVKDLLKQHDSETDLVEIKMKDDSTITTKLLIGSDGPNSFIRKQANFDVTQFEYDQSGIVATVKISPMDNVTAWQRFLPTGPIALLPLNNEYSSLVWSIEKQLAKDLMKLSDEEFVNQLNHAFVDESNKNNFVTNVDKMLDDGLTFLASFLKKQDVISEKVRQIPPRIEACIPNTRATYPLGFCHANNYVKNRIALIGDAAHRIHPLAGQGVNLGFGDVLSLMDKLRENVRSGLDLGSLIYLEKYERERQRDAYPKILFINFLNSLYTNRNSLFQTPTVLIRSLGLTFTNRFSPIKNFYVEGAMK